MSRELWLLLALCLAGGLYQNKDRIARWIDPPAPGSASVVLYATDWCGYCAETRKLFREHNVSYHEIDIDRDSDGHLAYDKLGARGVPVVVVDDTDVIHGYNPQALLKAVDR